MRQKFYAKMIISADVFEKGRKTPKMADFTHIEPSWNLKENFARHSVCSQKSSMGSSYSCRGMTSREVVRREQAPHKIL